MKWFITALVILLAALLLESGLLAYAMYVLLGVLLLSRWLARNWISNLSARRRVRLVRSREESDEPDVPATQGLDLTAEVGDRVRVRLVISNDGSLPVPWVLLEDRLPDSAIQRRSTRLKVRGKRLQIAMLRGGGEVEIRYQVECLVRGYYPIGPLVMEGGDLFGLHRRFRVVTEPVYLLVYPRIVPLVGYELASRRPIGDIRLTHRLYEDPTRIAGVRPYEAGDPLNRVHWRATARTGELHSKIYEPSTLAGATLMLDFHQAGYHRRGEPYRSELAITTAASLANAVCEMGQQVGLVTNARDAADRIREEEELHREEETLRTRKLARQIAPMEEESDRLRPLIVETRRSYEQLERIRQVLARAELTDGFTFSQLVVETASRLPRDATVVAILPEVSEETAISLGNLRRLGLAVTVVLITFSEDALEKAYARLTAEQIRDLRHLADEVELPELCQRQVERSSPYDFVGVR
jgi:uncharacterized protein (DUF58 family)